MGSFSIRINTSSTMVVGFINVVPFRCGSRMGVKEAVKVMDLSQCYLDYYVVQP